MEINSNQSPVASEQPQIGTSPAPTSSDHIEGKLIYCTYFIYSGTTQEQDATEMKQVEVVSKYLLRVCI